MRTIKFRGFDLFGNKQIGLLEKDNSFQTYFINNELIDDYSIGQFTGLYDVFMMLKAKKYTKAILLKLYLK